MSDKGNNITNFKHPSFQEAGQKAVTEVKYEAPRPETNQYDVQIHQMDLEQWKENAPLRWITTIGGILIGGVGLIGLIKIVLKE